MFGNHLKFGFSRLAMSIFFTKRDIPPFRVNLHLPFQHVYLSYWSKYLHYLCKCSIRAKFFPRAFFPHRLLWNGVRNELVSLFVSSYLWDHAYSPLRAFLNFSHRWNNFLACCYTMCYLRHFYWNDFASFHTFYTVVTLLLELACFNKANSLQSIL